MAEQPAGEKSLPASPRKLERAREEGNVARSQDLNSAWALIMALVAFYLLGMHMLEHIVASGAFFLGNADMLIHAPHVLVGRQALWMLAQTMLPFMLVMAASGLVVSFLQTGWLLTPKPLAPKASRINPISGFQRIFFSLRALVELAKSLGKIAIVATIVWYTMRHRLGDLLALMYLDPLPLVGAVAELLFSVWWRVAAAMLVLGILDLAYQRWQYARDQRMTVQEARQESKEMEGDPHVKRRVRQIQRQLAMQRMMAEVPEADVIITNPTEYAVALRYKASEMESPVVVAKGMRLIAQRIRDIGEAHRVPIVEKRELARTLYRSVEVGQPIPEALFRAVAEVLSYVYRIDRRREKIRERAALQAGAADARRAG